MGADGENRIRVAGLLIALPDRSNTRTKVRQRKWSETHETGAAPIRRNDPWEAKAVCPAAAKWRDLHMGTIHHAMAKYDYDGTYIDLFIPYPYANTVHGCGYVDDNGRR